MLIKGFEGKSVNIVRKGKIMEHGFKDPYNPLYFLGLLVALLLPTLPASLTLLSMFG